MSFLAWFFIVYGVLALTHILFQMLIGHLEHRRQKHKYFKGYHDRHHEKVSVVVPVYNEDPAILNEAIKSIYEQDHADLEILVVDDGSQNYKELNEKVYKNYNHGRAKTLVSKKNIGKRHAQRMAFDKAKGDIIVTVDSDTILRSKKTISRIVKRFRDPEVGAVTGDVRVENAKQNLLTRLISYRYWTAFHQERAAQSYFSVLMCCSGPFSAYRKTIIDDVKDRYNSQTFLGQLCTFGDDRHLTNLILEEGHQVVFDNKAVVYTYVPTTLPQYLKQQVRWNKSFYREMLWTLKSINKHSAYLIYDLLMQLILPFLLIVALIATIIQAFLFGPAILIQYTAILIGIAFIRALYGLYRTKDVGFLLFIVYGFVHVLLLIPTRMYALLTIAKVKWGTR